MLYGYNGTVAASVMRKSGSRYYIGDDDDDVGNEPASRLRNKTESA